SLRASWTSTSLTTLRSTRAPSARASRVSGPRATAPTAYTTRTTSPQATRSRPWRTSTCTLRPRRRLVPYRLLYLLEVAVHVLNLRGQDVGLGLRGLQDLLFALLDELLLLLKAREYDAVADEERHHEPGYKEYRHA